MKTAKEHFKFLGADFPSGSLNKNNHSKVIVTNTSENWYVHTNHFDKWKYAK